MSVIQHLLITVVFVLFILTTVALSRSFPKKRGEPYELWRWLVVITLFALGALFVVTALMLLP